MDSTDRENIGSWEINLAKKNGIKELLLFYTYKALSFAMHGILTALIALSHDQGQQLLMIRDHCATRDLKGSKRLSLKLVLIISRLTVLWIEM